MPPIRSFGVLKSGLHDTKSTDIPPDRNLEGRSFFLHGDGCRSIYDHYSKFLSGNLKAGDLLCVAHIVPRAFVRRAAGVPPADTFGFNLACGAVPPAVAHCSGRPCHPLHVLLFHGAWKHAAVVHLLMERHADPSVHRGCCSSCSDVDIHVSDEDHSMLLPLWAAGRAHPKCMHQYHLSTDDFGVT